MSEIILTPTPGVITLGGLDKIRPKVTVLNCWNAEKYRLPVPVISFCEWNGLAPNERHTYPLGTHHVDVQRIYCDDVEDQIDASYRLFDYIDAVKIITFLDKHRGQDIMVHCAAGVSRSPACAKFMLDYLGYRLDEFNNHSNFFDRHNTVVYYNLKRAMLDHTGPIERIKAASYGKEKEV
ncbi:virion structural protein [Pseudomonas phage 201phi2-1]|uniref:Virion structural protein n=1 Tax=Pseudomonas phage 201phi2-1 TaxID=198110 RepID=B3FK37_BP201|nr:virion structural protein [Pseudomonas phage 201phi2-1]ABY62895.1 virion structural protein [Pseudomonas phage 201phi2-1]